jgi:hypothetical protein
MPMISWNANKRLLPFRTQEMRLEALNPDGRARVDVRVDTYHMSSDNLCGVELTDDGILTVTQFKVLDDESDARPPFRQVKKFESIVLNGADPTRSGGRVKSKVHCSLTDDTVTYVTKVPVLTDGVRSPWVIEELRLKVEDSVLAVSLRASVTPIDRVFRSITACDLELN